MTNTPSEAELSSRLRWILITLLLVFVVINLLSLTDYPAPYCDEASRASRALSFVNTGRYDLGINSQIRDVPRARVPLTGLLEVSALGLFLRIGNITHLAARVYAYFGFLVAGVAVFLAGQKLRDTFTGVVATLVLFASLNIYRASHIARPEIWSVAATAFGLYVHLASRKQPSYRRYFIVGALIVFITTETYISNLFFSIGLLIVVLYHLIREQHRYRLLLSLSLGLLTASLLWLVLHLLPDPNGIARYFLDNTTDHCGNALCAPGTGQSLSQLIAQPIGTTLAHLYIIYIRDWNGLALPFAIYAGLGLIWIVTHRTNNSRTVLLLWGTAAFLFVLFPYKSPFYGVLWDPVIALIVACATVEVACRMKRPAMSPHARALVLIAPLLFLNLSAQVWFGMRFASRDFVAYQQRIRRHIPPGTHVMADPVLWFAFHDRNTYTSDWYWYVGTDLTEQQGLSDQIGAIMQDRHIAYAVDDGTLACINQPTPFSQAYTSYLQSACTPVATVEDRFFGAYGHLGQGQSTVIYDCTAVHLK